MPTKHVMRWMAVVSVTWAMGPAVAQANRTQTTTYTYNPDGALTSTTTVTESAEGEVTEEVHYFTWDNCVPEMGDASRCALSPANGNLLGIGVVPRDESEWSAHYDVLDRLVQAMNQAQQTAVYRYHPDELLAASLNADSPSTDGLQHYYDESHYPQVTNLYDRHTGTLSTRHQRIRYLQDGTEQMLVRHRKDVDGVYDLKGQTMRGYQYDPYGATVEFTPPALDSTASGPLYSNATNPYQYSNELRDPVSGADYLRARWYLPGHQTFLQRDPVPNLNRYGYGNGNPVTNHDPSGQSAKKFGEWLNKLSAFKRGMLGMATLGIAPLVGTAGLEGKAYWVGGHGVRTFEVALHYANLVTSVVALVPGYQPAAAVLGAGTGVASLSDALAQHPHQWKRTLGSAAWSTLGGAVVVGGVAFVGLAGALGNRSGESVLRDAREGVLNPKLVPHMTRIESTLRGVEATNVLQDVTEQDLQVADRHAEAILKNLKGKSRVELAEFDADHQNQLAIRGPQGKLAFVPLEERAKSLHRAFASSRAARGLEVPVDLANYYQQPDVGTEINGRILHLNRVGTAAQNQQRVLERLRDPLGDLE